MTAAPSHLTSGRSELRQCPVCHSRLVGLFERQEGLFVVSCENDDDCHFTVEALGSTAEDAVRRWNARAVAQAAQVPRADEDQIKTLILKHCTVNEQKVLLRTVWKDGIDIDRPRTCIMNIADDLLASSVPSTHQLPGAAMAEPTTVAADLDSGDARPNRELDSPDRGQDHEPRCNCGHLFELCPQADCTEIRPLSLPSTLRDGAAK